MGFFASLIVFIGVARASQWTLDSVVIQGIDVGIESGPRAAAAMDQHLQTRLASSLEHQIARRVEADLLKISFLEGGHPARISIRVLDQDLTAVTQDLGGDTGLSLVSKVEAELRVHVPPDREVKPLPLTLSAWRPRDADSFADVQITALGAALAGQYGNARPGGARALLEAQVRLNALWMLGPRVWVREIKTAVEAGPASVAAADTDLQRDLADSLRASVARAFERKVFVPGVAPDDASPATLVITFADRDLTIIPSGRADFARGRCPWS